MTTAPDGRRRRRIPLSLTMAAGLLAGGGTGLLWPHLAAGLQPVGTAFVAAIKMVVVPLVFAAVTVGAARMGHDARQLGRMAAVAFGWITWPAPCRWRLPWASTG